MMRLEECGHRFRNTFQAGLHIHRKIGDSDVLISIGQNIADFNGYIEMNRHGGIVVGNLAGTKHRIGSEQVLKSNYDISHQQAKEISLTF
ncbi:MAG: hypothetical protein ACLTCB_00045 [Merdibacter sp.]